MHSMTSAQNMLESIAAEVLAAPVVGEKEVYRIGDLAREFDVSLRTLRFYEDRGLISPTRSGSTRLYSPEDRTRLKVILLIKSVGFSLVDIQELLAIYDGDGAEAGVKKIRKKFGDQLESLRDQKSQVEQSINDLEKAIATIGNTF